MPLKIALLGIYHESNTFLESPTTLSDFINGHFLLGDDIVKEYRNAYHEIGGMIEVVSQAGLELIPVMYAEATPGGIISEEAYNTLLQKMIDELGKVLPVDGCLVVPHGAAVSETFSDMDGHWLSALRNKVGRHIPVIGTIDPHANVSQLMVASTDTLIAYKTNPHVDQREVGKQAANLLIQVLRKEIYPIQTLIQIPLAISIEQQYTGNEPCKSLFKYASELCRKTGVLNISVVFGFPYADVWEMGTAVIIISDSNTEVSLIVAEQLKSYIINNKEQFIGDKKDITALLPLLPESRKPVLMLDMGDNVGGGAPGNSIFLLKALEVYGKCKFFICLYDPEVVLQAEKHDLGESFAIVISIGNGEAFEIRVILLQLSDGKFKETYPRHGGQVNYDMGNIAIVSTPKGNIIMFTSLRISPFSLEQLTCFGILPGDFDVIVAKGVNAPIAAYAPVCPTIMQVNTPGVTQADMTQFVYKNRRRPLFPFESL
jgi:microcystin degradation protein MlrC